MMESILITKILFSLVLLLTLPTLIIKLIVYIINLKFKIKISFKLFKLHQLASIRIVKQTQSGSETKFEIYIDKVWFSSCYLNRQINNRIVLCLNNVNINYFNNQSEKSNSNRLVDFILHIYFKYIGSLSIENLNFKFFSQNKLNLTLNQVKIETNKQNAILNTSSSNLKLINKKFELNLDLSIRETCLKFDLNKLDSIDLCMQNAVCLVNSNNKLINLDQRYDENNYLIEYLNSIDLNRKSKSSDYFNKIHNVEISNFQCKIINSATSEKNKKIKLDEIKLSNANVSEKFALVKNLTYSTARNRNKLNLLTKLLIGYKTTSNDLTLECDNLNLFLHFKFIKDIIDSNVLKLLIRKSKQKTSNSHVRSFNLKITNSYIHLNDDTKLIYSFGASRFNLTKSNEIKIDIRQPIVFKSTPFNTQPKQFLNNLFEMINVNSNCLNTRNTHYWGSLVRLNKFHFKKSNNLCSLSLGSLAFEYSIDNLRLVDYLNDFYQQILKLDLIQTTRESQTPTKVKLNIKSIDFYLLYKEKYLINFNLTNINYKHLSSDFNLTTDGFAGVKYILQDVNKIQSQEVNQQQISYCFIEEKSKISSLIFLVEEINLNKRLNKYYLSVRTVQLTWSLQIHYILYETLIKPFKFSKNSSDKLVEFKLLVESDILLNLELNYANDSSKRILTNLFYLPITTSQVNQAPVQTVSIVLTDAYLNLSNQSEFRFNFKETSMFINTTHASEFFTDTELLTSESIFKQKLQNDCNKRQFVCLKSFEISTLTNSNLLVYERALLNTSNKKNKLTLVTMDYLNLNFIFNYDFAKLIDHLLNIRKCLLKIHNVKSTKTDRLSTDLMIQIKKFQLTIEDDPFEIKLAYNYALMKDEHVESMKRHETLEQSRLIKEQNLEKEALEILNERESLIYMQRSNKIYGRNEKFKSQQQRSVRTELFCLTVENFDFYALCDSDWHTRQQCYELLRKIDKHSPLSPTMMQSNNPASLYQILWCRFVNLNLDELKFLFRDYTQPLLKLNKINLFGNLIGGELEPASRARRDVKIAVFDHLEDDLLDENVIIQIERSMSPIKFYHDLCTKMGLFQVAYGPCWEGTMAQCNLALDKIIHPARDPSKPMPWWDKSRLYLHGDFTAHVNQLQIIYHVSMDPYNRTEEMKWVWTQLFFDWTNMQMIFKGDLDIFLNTESKYDDCRFLHLPNLELKLKIDWICKNNHKNKNLANLHNNVMPCAPDKLPVIINSSEHDSYAQFRSENVNISVSFVCNLSQLDDLPTCKFYASTSRFIQRIKTLLSTITRPIRRGKIFQNIKLKKPILSRHFKITNINFDIPKLNIIYWSSASEEYGTLVECEHFKLNSTHKLELLPFLDNLKRRPKPNWSIEIMKCKLAQTTIYLMGPLNRNTSPANQQQQQQPQQSIKFLESQRVTRSFFMQIDSIFYEREKNLSASSLFFNENKKLSNDEESHDEDLLLSSSTNPRRSKSKSKFLSYSFKSPKRADQETKNKSGSFKIQANKKSTPPPMNRNLNYSREEATLKNVSITSLIPFKVKNIPKHNIQIRNLKAKWNNINRDVIYILYEIYNKSKRLRHNISSQALKEYDLLTDQIVQSFVINNSNLNASQINLSRKSSVSGSKNPMNQTIGSFDNETNTNTFFEELLNKLDTEREINSEVYCDEKKLVEYNELLYGVHAANKMSDIINENIFIEIINSQVKLSLESDVLSTTKQQTATTPSNPKQKTKPVDSPFECLDDNYLIISAAKANVVQRLHKPVWKSQRLLDKTSWNGYLEGMQYFATLDTGTDDKQFNMKQFQQFKDEYWLPDDLIDPNESNSQSEQIKQTKLSDEISNSSSSGSNAPLVIVADPIVTKTNLGMLVACNATSEPQQWPNLNVNNKQKVDETSIKEKRRFGFGKSNRKLAKPELNLDSQNQSSSVANNRYLQLIVSKCRCEFYMIDFDDKIPNADEYNPNNTLNYSHLYQKLERQASIDENLFNSYSTSSVNLSHNTLNNQIDLNSTFNEPIDCISLIHYDLNLCTNSKQYKMIMNLVNNLVLYFRPRRKQVIDKQKAIKFNLQLSMGNLESLKSHIQLKQIEAKELMCRIRAMERKLYYLRERIQSEIRYYQEQQPMDQILIASQLISIQELNNENLNMEKEYKDTKNRLNELSDELNISISCYKEIILEKRAYTLANTTQHILSNNPMNTNYLFNKYKLSKNAKKLHESHIKLEQAQQSILNNEVGKRYEIWFKKTQWNLNDLDGQTGCAQFLMKNFLYTKVTNQQELDCVEHTLEIESCKLKDLSEINTNANSNNNNNNNNSNKRKDSKVNNLDNFVLTALYDESLDTTNDDSQTDFDDSTFDSGDISLVKNNNDLLNNNSSMIRVYCKERPPIGIPVFEHVELNVSPLSINLTNNFFKMMMTFFFNNPSQTQTNSTNMSSSITSQNDFKFQQPPPSHLLSRNSNFRHSYHNQFSVQSNDDQMHLNLITNNSNSFVLSPSISPLSIESLNNNTANPSLVPLSPSNSTILSPNYSVNLQSLQSPSPQIKQLKNIHKKPSQASLFNIDTSTQLNNNLTQASTSSQLQNDDIEIMKQRAANNNTFLCIKIPEIQLLVSYRATNKDKNNVKDLTKVSLIFPLFEEHDKTWTYVDLINALKSHVKKAVLSQVVKHKMKVPIQPVNKLISRTKRSNSQQHLSNLDLDECEQITFLKFFGTKFIEKKSSTPSILQNSVNLVPSQIDSDLLQQHKLLNTPTRQFLNNQEDSTSELNDSVTKKSTPKTKKPLFKSNSLLYFKKNFLKFNNSKDTSNSNNNSILNSSDVIDTSVNNIPSLDESK